MDDGRRRMRRIDYAAAVAFMLQLVLWIFSQGLLWQSVNDLRGDVTEIKNILLQKGLR